MTLLEELMEHIQDVDSYMSLGSDQKFVFVKEIEYPFIDSLVATEKKVTNRAPQSMEEIQKQQREKRKQLKDSLKHVLPPDEQGQGHKPRPMKSLIKEVGQMSHGKSELDILGKLDHIFMLVLDLKINFC